MSWHPDGRYVEVLGRRAHCVDAGRGPAVLLLHGFLHSSWTWRFTLESLVARGFRVIAPDLLGAGWSDRGPGDHSLPALRGWVDGVLGALGVEHLHAAVGNSLGGAVAIDLALERPGRVGRLLLVSPLAAALPLPGLPLRLLGHRAFEPVFRATAANPDFVRRALGLLAYRKVPVDEAVLAGFAHLARPGSLRSAIETARQFWPASVSVAGRLHALRAPTVLVWGARDGVLPLRYGRAVAARLPAARLEVFEDCGHCPQEEDPIRFQAVLAAFLGAPPALPAPSREGAALHPA